MKINLLDLFSGIGGFHLGLKKAGYEINSYFSEVDKYAIEVFKNNFKNSNYVGSITDIQSKNLPKINAITFGSPCQDFSLAGKRKGMEGSRSSLISEAIRLISECRPDFFIWENVKGTFSSNSGEDFWAIIQAFANIGGYRLEWQLLNTKWFLPQNRERIYLVGYLGGKSGGQIFPIGENNRENYKPNDINATNSILARYKADNVGSYIEEGIPSPQKEFEITDKRSNIKSNKEASTLVAGYYKQPSDADYIKIKSATKRGYELAKEGDSINYSTPTSKTRRGRVGKGVSQTLDTACEMAVVGTLRTHNDGKGFRKIKDGVSPCIPARAREDGSGQPIISYVKNDYNFSQKALNETLKNADLSEKDTKALDLYNKKAKDDSPTLTEPHHNSLRLYQTGKIRRLTPLECERLQGFPDNWTKYGTQGIISDTQRYKMCGNAVTVNVVEAVAKRIKTQKIV